MRYIAFDTETGGINPKITSLLTAHFAILDYNLNVLDRLDLKVKPDSGEFFATTEALGINKIDLQAHAREAITYSEASDVLYSFLRTYSDNGKDKLIPIAHNIDFDLGFVNEHVLDKLTWEKYVSYRKLDTSPIANFLKLAGKIPQEQKTGLGDLAKFLDIPFIQAAHTAEGDVNVMIEVLKKFKDLVRS